ncbi:MAG: hypothetical protein ACRCVI_00070 [Mycoplasmoidaceae bacterium]
MKHLLVLINSHFFNSLVNPFFAFLFPSIFMIILGLLLGYPFLFGGLIALPSMTVSLFLLPLAFFEFKNSVLLKRIVVTKISPWMFVFTIFIYYFVIMLISTIIIFLTGMAVFSKYWSVGIVQFSNETMEIIAPSLQEYFMTANWFGLIWGIIMNTLIGSSIGILIVSLSKSVLSIQGITIPLLILSQFLAGQSLPVSMVKEIPALWYLGYLSPFKYSSGLIIESWSSLMVFKDPIIMTEGAKLSINLSLEQSSIFDVNQVFYSFRTGSINKIDIYETYDKILNLVMPFIIYIIAVLLSLKFFKSSTR